MSYTTFEYSNLEATPEVSTKDESFTVTFDVKNTGKMAADDVAQIYLSPADGNKNIRPIQLQGFARVSLKPGESKKLSVKMYTEQLGFYSNNGARQWNILPGKFIIKIGASSQDIKLQQEINLDGEAVKMPLRKYYFSEAKQI